VTTPEPDDVHCADDPLAERNDVDQQAVPNGMVWVFGTAEFARQRAATDQAAVNRSSAVGRRQAPLAHWGSSARLS
jgi:hypothetical protein